MQRENLKTFDLPEVPGVYLFKKGRKVLYVGKATSLRDRVRSYFDDALIATRGPRVVDMVTLADAIAYETTPTVLEALVREAALITKYDPPANAMGKDDKSFLYAVITDEPIPRVLAFRGTEIDFEARKITSYGGQDVILRAIYGPFPSGAQLREGLRLIRRIFPFYDTDKPLMFDFGTAHVIPMGKGLHPIGHSDASRKSSGESGFTKSKHGIAKLEFNRQIGHYPHSFDMKSYRRSIRNVSMFLSGNVKKLRKTLASDMQKAANEERFEDAAEIRCQLFALDHIQDVSLIKEDRGEDIESPRIEAYDTAHLSGTNAIGVMTVIERGVAVKKDYRTFRIRGKHVLDVVRPTSDVGHTTSGHGRRVNDDIASLKELLTRRLPHTEWEYPCVIVVDGGKTHKKAAEEVLREAGVGIPVVAVVKDEKHRPREVIGYARAGISQADAVLANSEAHRFSLSRHRRARSKNLRVS